MFEYQQTFKSKQIFLWEIKSDNEVFNGINRHTHRECEVYYMIDGQLEIWLEGHGYHVVTDSLLLMPSNCTHQWIYPSGKISRRICIHFLPEMLNSSERSLFEILFKKPLHFLNVSQYDLDFYIRSITNCSLIEKPVQNIAIKSRMIALLSQILYLSSTKAVKPAALDKRIINVITYLEDNFKKDVTLNDLSSRFAITKNHLNFLFHKTVGMPIKKYVNIKRLIFARQEILGGERSSEAAYHAGFHDYTSFFRAYKSFYGSSPSEQTANVITGNKSV